MKRIIVSILLVVALLAGCSSSDTSDTTQADSSAAETTQPSADVASDDSPAAQDADFRPPPPPADGRYLVGDTYFDVDLSATYLGLAQIPVGPDIYTGGSCFTVLLEVNRYADQIGLGPEKFQASVGQEVNCSTSALDNPRGAIPRLLLSDLDDDRFQRRVTVGL